MPGVQEVGRVPGDREEVSKVKKRRRIVDLKVLPGEPLNGAGRVCIHLFVPDGTGPITERHVTQLRDIPQEDGSSAIRLTVAPSKGHLACDRKRSVAPVERRGVVTVTMRTIEPYAVTCPACRASVEYERLMKLLSGPGPAVAEQQAEEQEHASRTSGPGFGGVHGGVERSVSGNTE